MTAKLKIMNSKWIEGWLWMATWQGIVRYPTPSSITYFYVYEFGISIVFADG